MADINTVTLTGRLTRDAEQKYTSGNTAYCTFSIANNLYEGKAKGETAHFFDCVLWGRLAEAIGQYLTKGKQVVLSGVLKQERWQDKDGNNRAKLKVTVENIVLVNSGNGGGSRPEPQQNNNQTETSYPDQFEDDIPF